MFSDDKFFTERLTKPIKSNEDILLQDYSITNLHFKSPSLHWRNPSTIRYQAHETIKTPRIQIGSMKLNGQIDGKIILLKFVNMI